MVDFMRYRFPFLSINNFFDFKIMFMPSIIVCQGFSNALCQRSLAATASYEFVHRKTDILKYPLKLNHRRMHIMHKNRFRVVECCDLKATIFKCLEHTLIRTGGLQRLLSIRRTLLLKFLKEPQRIAGHVALCS